MRARRGYGWWYSRAALIGIPVADYAERRAAGMHWCSIGKHWCERDAMLKTKASPQHPDGVNSACRACFNRYQKDRNRRLKEAPTP